MKIAYYRDKNLALLAGLDVYGWTVEDCPAQSITQGQRTLLATFTFQATGAPAADYWIPINIKVAPEDTVQTILQKIIDEKARKERDTKEWEERQRAQKEQEITEFIANLPGDLIERAYGEWQPIRFLEDRWEHPRLADLYNRIKAQAEQKNKEEREEKKRKEEEAKAKKEQGLILLRDWALAHGSDLLRARIEGKYSWSDLAANEYVASKLKHFHGFAEADCLGEEMEVNNCTTPTLDDIRALERAREIAQGHGVSVRIVRAKYWDDDNNNPTWQNEIEATIKLPDGSTLTIYLVPIT